MPNEQFWTARLTHLRAFVDEHGRMPRRTPTTPSQERSLSVWLANQRRYLAAGHLAPHREEQLDILLPAWRYSTSLPVPGQRTDELAVLTARLIRREARWADSLTQLVSFIHTQGRLPRSTADDRGERRLADWLHTQRRNHRKGLLQQGRRHQLDQALPDWQHHTTAPFPPTFTPPAPTSDPVASTGHEAPGSAACSRSGFQSNEDSWIRQLSAVAEYLAAAVIVVRCR
ncbi:hypothetical protein GIS00_26575 [Nakamurella sp. YIM 132087]|uniref:Helicase-associated domain-containing protein n=1 Tax=Nakamurella alba TaxID=2665158 RepID=A0A7K1FTP8_9ACTN|nr:helicase associated domain-containing protein [Nakamurella alba]MTD17498.1 hypothetical protein [Nakamurella alba]